MNFEAIAPWAVLAVTCGITWMATPRRVTSPQFFDGRAADGACLSFVVTGVSNLAATDARIRLSGGG